MKTRKEQMKQLVLLLNYLKEKNMFWKRELESFEIIDEDNIEKIYEDLPILSKDIIKDNIEKYLDSDFVKCFADIEQMKNYIYSTHDLSHNNDKFIENENSKWEIKMTTGTTGIPFPVVVNCKEEFIASKYLMKQRKKIYEKANLNNGFLLAHEIDPKIRNMNYRADSEGMKEVIDYFINKNPKWMFVSVNSLKRFVSAALKYRAQEVRNVEVKFIETTGAKFYKEDEEFVKLIFDCPIINHYGCREAWYLAYQCSCGRLHTNTDSVLIDLIDKDRKIIHKENIVGEVVVTNLLSKTMPFIKYYLGDYASISYENCECGIKSSVINLSVGRVNEQLKNTKYNGSEVFRQILRVLCFKKNVVYDKIYIVQDNDYHLVVYTRLFSNRQDFERMFLEVSNTIIERFDDFIVEFCYEFDWNSKDDFLKDSIFLCKV